ncbi:MAG: glycosyltransferase [Proteobacteria bacterium]|nr:glycosyltransferase [Pseudomonadota bacterium]
MITEYAGYVLIFVYMTTAFLLMIYGLNCYVMIYLFTKNGKKAAEKRQNVRRVFDDDHAASDLPRVTTQIPIFNEYNVAERIIRSVCAMTYPLGRHDIQVLDDSTDETRDLVDQLVREYSDKGHDIVCLRRKERVGYKAGALAEGFTRAKGDFVAIFDADFVPPHDFLIKSMPFFLVQENLGLVQARWGHLNTNHSMLTRAQSIGIDGHFMVEQGARNGAGLYMNFNGTAGIFRKQAISDAGGWQWDTLTEDMDLSYRVQFAGWETLYLPDLVVPAEIPEDIRAFKSQQFRWAKGSMETALKLFPTIFGSRVSVFKKMEAFFHLTHYMVHPLMLLLSILALPVMTVMNTGPGPVMFGFLAILLFFSMSAPSALYLVSQRSGYKNWLSRIIYLPFLIITGTGIALSNSRAVFEALIGHKSAFIRTPKKGDKQKKKYRTMVPVSALFELGLGLYCAFSFCMYMAHGKYLVGPFLGIYATGYLYTGILTLLHSLAANES